MGDVEDAHQPVLQVQAQGHQRINAASDQAEAISSSQAVKDMVVDVSKSNRQDICRRARAATGPWPAAAAVVAYQAGLLISVAVASLGGQTTSNSPFCH